MKRLTCLALLLTTCAWAAPAETYWDNLAVNLHRLNMIPMSSVPCFTQEGTYSGSRLKTCRTASNTLLTTVTLGTPAGRAAAARTWLPNVGAAAEGPAVQSWLAAHTRLIGQQILNAEKGDVIPDHTTRINGASVTLRATDKTIELLIIR
ncbi:hypothetical protein [Deinococcus soli (ex Cha et al. 2016)]|uniref:Uncharacterized protein n=2 Tax=Deinococcus soli (ex Cha et al. 2016) TaxID=1309411 RepID=A0ACC6KGN8_9DEIO|nr:hypothetical protein [Deinococcus soli (ex Cha et al. 2016)]MDR6218116.1 hypothetical protein [Deinococcus soli (ex Cha et al. 2016)]MDR6328856.1 hypothetical protein [Deinococcus soli (ex Cha et al. 2016)]MDR6751656.1 hypothetical protein [Deinococcus soli (ex Cha et al. 2016)]